MILIYLTIGVLAIARGDGTLFDANSLKEDIVELCVEVGQAHTKGVLQLSVTELAIAFQSSEEMLATACVVTKATAWHDEPIKLCTCPPSTILGPMWLGGEHVPQAPSL